MRIRQGLGGASKILKWPTMPQVEVDDVFKVVVLQKQAEVAIAAASSTAAKRRAHAVVGAHRLGGV